MSIDASEDIAPPTPSGKFAANLAAIVLIKQLEAEGRQATADEQQILVRYTGWGWAGELFNEEKEDKRRDRLRPLLTDAEYTAAKASITNAHYTSPQVIGAMWSMVRRLGFTGGRVLEPAMGVGHFFGAMPADLRNYSDPIGVELDNLSAAISKQLYPDFDIRHDGFEKTRIPNNSIDLAISNVPFGSYDIAGTDYNNLRIHDYFFARALDKVKPGGLVVFITSHWTMDKSSRKVRELLASKGDLIAAVRLPATAFAKNAGTEVTTDILIFRKHDGKPFPLGQQFNGLTTVGTDTVRHPNGTTTVEPILINEYFGTHPEDALGRHSLQGSMRHGSGEYTLLAPKGGQAAIEEQMAAAIERLPQNVAGTNAAEQGPEIIAAPATSRNLSFVEQDGQVYQVMGDSLIAPDWMTMSMRATNPEAPIDAKTQAERVQIARDWIKLRDAARAHLALENDIDTPAEKLTQSRRGLTLRYDAYAGRHGTLTRQHRHLERAFFLEEDPSYPFVQGVLENERITIDPISGKEKYEYLKGDVFRKRIREPKQAPTTAANAADAISISMGYNGTINVGYIQGLLGLATPEEAATAIAASGSAFLDPESGLFQTQDRYLSGNVRIKLAKAREAAQSDARFAANVKALEAVQPPRKALSAVSFNLGARWLPIDVLTAFATELFAQPVTVTYSEAANAYSLRVVGRATPEALTTYGSPRMDGVEAFHHMIDGTYPQVFDQFEDEHGNKRRVLNKNATSQARKAGDKIKAAFRTWVRSSDTFIGTREQIPAEILEDAYNERYNSIVPPQYNGEYLTLPGATNYVYRKAHRLSVVARILQERSGVMAHGVGSGKTVSQIVAAMELRRLGLSKKPMIVVHKATIGQFAAEFMRAYPDAKLLVANEKSFNGIHRKRFMSRIAGGDYDAIVVTQPQFDRLQSSERAITSYFQEKINEFEAAIREEEGREKEAGERGKSRTQKQLEAMKRSFENRMAVKLAAIRKLADQTVAFEELGVDFLLIDEAHAYKRLPIITRRTRVKGIPTGASDKAMNLDMKRRSVQDKQNGRGVVLATGTPVTNTMAEVYVMLALGAPHVLEEYGITNFDHFANTFGEMQEKLEFTWAGTWKMVDRFNKFTNGRELIAMIRTGFDVKMGNERLGLDVPKMRGDKPEIQIVKQTPATQRITDWLLSAANQFDATTDKRDVSWVPIVVMGTGMSAAVDPRLVDPTSEDHPDSKVNTAVRRVAGIHKDSAGIRGTQLILVDRFAYKPPESLLGFAGSIGGDGQDAQQQDPQVTIDDTDPDAQVDGAAADAAEDADEKGRAALEDAEFNSGGFNLYKDIKAKLIASGIPESEIAIIHEHNSDKKREKLFAAVNAGTVRVLLGSTEKLGVGVNIQARLVAMHQLDPPRSMTPAMAAQRLGRIIRQGNMFATPKLPDGTDNPMYNPDFRVDVVMYGLERSMDVGIYQMLESKGRFITQALLGELEGDTFEDAADELTMSNSEMKAQLSGNPDVLLLVELQHKVRTLAADREAFENQISDNQRRRAQLLRDIAFLERDIPRETAVAQGLETAFPAGEEGAQAVTFTPPNGRDIAGREQVVEALNAWFKIPGAYRGKLNGYSLELKVEAPALEDQAKPADQMELGQEPGQAPEAKPIRNVVHYSLRQPDGFLIRGGRYVKGGNHLLNDVWDTAQVYRAINVNEGVRRLAEAKKQIPALEEALTERWGGEAALARAEIDLAATERRLQGTSLGAARGVVLRPGEPSRSMRRSEQGEGQFAKRRDQTETPQFKAWFKDSKVVDQDGRPLVVYHGTTAPVDFNAFEFADPAKDQGIYAGGKGFYFASDTRSAGVYADGENGRVVPVYLSLQNPADKDTFQEVESKIRHDGVAEENGTRHPGPRERSEMVRDELIRRGYDGVAYQLSAWSGGNEGDFVYVAFKANQIKSATGNSGAFDPANDDIRFANRREQTASPQFKRWFGDSKFVDEAGEPIVFAHGSEHRNLTTFDHGRAGGLFWFSRDRGTAEAYAHNRAGIDRWDESAFMRSFESGQLADINAANVVDVYLSAQKPLDLTTPEGMAVIGTIDKDFNQANTTPDQRHQAANIIALAAGELHKAQYLLWTTTQSERLDKVWMSIIVPQLQAKGYDGLIMPDAADTGTSYAVFEPTQIKSATGNSGAFDPANDDINFANRRTNRITPSLTAFGEFAQRPAGTPSAAVWNLVAPMAAGPAAGFAISDAETDAGRALVDSFRKDTASQSTGIRHINEYLANQLDVEIREGHSGRAGTTGKNPAVFIPGADLIRTRSGSWQLVLHDLGHMIGNLLEAADNGFMNQHGAELMQIGLAEGSFATTHRDLINFAPWDPAGLSTTPAEGFAEWIRRFIWDPASLDDASMPNHVNGIILRALEQHLPAVRLALRDAHRMASAWADRSLESRLRSYAAGEAELRPKIGDTMKGLGRFLDRLLFMVNAEHALGSRVIRPMMRGLKRVSSGLMAVAQDKMTGSDADVEAIAQQEYHVGGETNRLLFGPPRHDKAGKGLRIRETGGNAIAAIMAALGAADPALAARFAGRFNLAGVRRTGTKAGHWLYLTDYDIQDVILAITQSGRETGRWAQFEYYVQYREAINRARDRWDVLDADGKWVSTHFTEADANTALAALPPAVQPTLPGMPAAPARTGSIVERPGMTYPGLTEGVDLSSLIQEIAKVEKANPDFRIEADRLNRLMDQRVLAAVIMGQFTPAQAMTIVDSRESYAPLLRQFDGPRPGADGGSLAARMVGTTSLPGAEPVSGVRRAYGSALPFKPLVEAIETNLRELLTGYNRHRTIKSVAALVQMAATMPDVPDEFRREMLRIMTPVPMSLMPAVTLTREEQARFVQDVVKAINERTAQAMGTTVSNLLPADLVSDADLTIDFGDGSTIWRAQKPKGINLVALFDGPGSGKRTLYEITDPVLFDYFARVREPAPALKWWATVWRGVNNATRRGVLKTVEFVVRNLSRDIKTALVLGPREAGGAALIPGYFMAKAIVDSVLGGRRSRQIPGGADIQDTELWGEALKAVSAPEHQARANTIWGGLAATLSEGVLIPDWSSMGWGTRLAHVPGQAVSTILKPLDLVAHATGLNKLSDWVERLSRRGAYLSVVEAGGTPERAQLAYDKVSGNFIGRGGSSQANAMVSTGLFLNAMLQTTYQLWDNLADPSKRGGTALRLGIAAATGTISALITYAMMGDDDREKLKLQPLAERLKNMHIHIPGTDIVLRLPFAYGAEGATESWGYNLTMNALLGEKVESGAMLADSFKRIVSLDSLLGLLTPAGKLAVEFWANKTLYDGREVIPGYLTDELPEMQYTTRTSELAKGIGETAGISPAGLEHTINSLVGRNLLAVERVVESGGASVSELSDVPGVGALTAREPRGFNSRPVQEVYELSDQYEKARSLAKRLTEEGRYDDARITRANETMQRTAMAYSAALAIRKLSKATQAELGKDKPDRELIREWERLMTTVSQQALKP